MNKHEQLPAAAARLRLMIDSFRLSQAIGTAVQVGVPDALADGARSCDDVAAATGTHSPTLYRLLRALAATGIVREEGAHVFSLTDTGMLLTSSHPASMTAWARLISRPYFWNAWGNLAHSVRTGENAFSALNGTDVWAYRAAHPEENAIFNDAMSESTRLMAGAALAAAGVADRCESVGGDMFAAVPEGADAYTMKMILHDWEDAECIAILRVCRAGMAQGGRVLVFEQIVGPPNESPAEKMSDLNMLVMPGGRERTADEFGALFDASGLRLVNVTRTGSPVAIIEAEAAD